MNEARNRQEADARREAEARETRLVLTGMAIIAAVMASALAVALILGGVG